MLEFVCNISKNCKLRRRLLVKQDFLLVNLYLDFDAYLDVQMIQKSKLISGINKIKKR